MEFLFAYLAGLLTLINPCVLPILPIVLAASLQANCHGPAALAAGMAISFVALGMFVLVLGNSWGVTEARMIEAGAWAMLGFGLILLIPAFSTRFATLAAGMAARADMQMDAVPQTRLSGQFIGGALLGAVWSPCVGPTLGGAISLASQGQSLLRAGAIMVFFALGVASIILALGYGTREAILRRKDAMQAIAARSRPVIGAAFVLVAVMILTKTHHRIEAWLVNAMPDWLLTLSVAL